jgi:ribonuclease-3
VTSSKASAEAPADPAELAREAARLERAELILAHAFRDRALLLTALTHRSLLNEVTSSVPHNEVLELLGDAVLSLASVEALVVSSPGSDEGDLTVRRAAYVSEEHLARRADESGLVELLRTGKSIQGRVPVSARADLVEALLGAVYRDAGLEAARQVVRRLLGDVPASAAAHSAHAKRTLQERLQTLFGEPPQYDVERGDGPNHAPTYRAIAVFRGVRLGEGQGKNKRSATEAAAADALSRLDVDDDALRARLKAP